MYGKNDRSERKIAYSFQVGLGPSLKFWNDSSQGDRMIWQKFASQILEILSLAERLWQEWVFKS